LALVSCAVVGMAAFFTGVVRAPVTGIVLVIEMTASRLLHGDAGEGAQRREKRGGSAGLPRGRELKARPKARETDRRRPGGNSGRGGR
jgi:hypothetical protein